MMMHSTLAQLRALKLDGLAAGALKNSWHNPAWPH